MAAEPITVDNLPNPDEDSTAWNVLWTAGLPVPGQYVSASAEGDRERDVEHRKSKGSSRDVLQDQGLKPTEMTITIRTTSGTVLRELQSFYRQYMDPERPLNRRNISTISHPQVYALGVKQVYWYARQIPKPSKEGGDYPLLHVFKARIVGPKTQISAGEKSSKPKPPSSLTTPIEQKTFQGAVTTIKAIQDQGIDFFRTQYVTTDSGTSTLVKPVVRPPNQTVLLLTPAQTQKRADARDPSAQMLQAVLDSRSPR